MTSQLKYRFAAACLALILGPVAQAQLMLSGSVGGGFTGTPGPNDTIENAPDGSFSRFRSGIPETSSDVQTAIDFTERTFTDIGPGVVATDLFRITNGRTLLNSTATAAHFDLTLEIITPESVLRHLALSFGIENTPNQPNDVSVNDRYTFVSPSIAPVQLGDFLVQFEFIIPDSVQIPENEWRDVGELRVTFTPVPEPAAYAFSGAALMLAWLAVRVARRREPVGVPA